jgi:hypothetical protein
MIRACEITDSGMRCDEDGELCIAVSNKDTWVCWEHFQDMEAPNLKIIRQKISEEIAFAVLSDNTSDHYKLALPVLQKSFAAIARGK